MSVFYLDNKDNIRLSADYCEFYIPQSYFDSTKKFAEDMTETVQALGIFNVGVFENGELKSIKLMNNPNMMKIFVYDSEWRDVELPKGTERCMVLKFIKDQVVCSATLVQDSGNAEIFLNALITGSLPDNLPYTKLIHIWQKNIGTNKVNFGVSSVSLELILAVCYRSKKHPEYKFAREFGSSDSVSEYDYSTASIRQISQLASTFTSIIHEDFDSAVTTSINRAREGKPEAESPIEKIVKM